LLAGVAGFVDAAAYLMLHGVFVAHITGDTDRFGQALGRAALAAAAPIGLAVLEWTATIALVTAARVRVATALAAETALVVALMAWTGAGFYAREALAVCAMGVQTAAVVKWNDNTIRTTYLSGMLTRFAQSVARRRWTFLTLLYLLLWLGFLAGAVAGGWATLQWQRWALALPVGGLVVAIGLELA
jgi:uncharacterized membrane protein YoaK (UPF0700 family)